MKPATVQLGADLPRVDEAEAAVLGAVLVQNERLADIAGMLRVEHFAQRWCSVVYAAMLQLAKENRPIDFLTVKNVLGATVMEDVGFSRLAKLTDGVPRGSNVAHYADIVIDAARRRGAIARAINVIESAVDDGAEADDVITRAQEAFFRLAQTRRGDTMFSARQMTAEILPQLEALETRHYGLTGLATGIHDLDVMTNGLQPGELVVEGARPSVGKTALVLQIALAVARTAPVLFCSLEMGHRSLWERALFNLARVDGFRFKRGHLAEDPSTHRRIAYAITQLDPLQLWLDEQPGMSSIDIRAKAQQVQLRHGLKLVVVDYLQLMRPADMKAVRGQTRAQIVGDMVQDLKEIARTLNITVIALSQLRRPPDEKHRPTMADLRESGDIEAHADIILLLHRKETREELHELPVGQPSHIELLVEKQRGNPTGIINLLNFREHYRFASATRGDVDPMMFDQAEAAS